MMYSLGMKYHCGSGRLKPGPTKPEAGLSVRPLTDSKTFLLGAISGCVEENHGRHRHRKPDPRSPRVRGNPRENLRRSSRCLAHLMPQAPSVGRRQRSPTRRHKESKRPPHRHHHAPRPRPAQAASTIFNFRSSQPGEKKRTKRRAQQRGNLKSFAAETKRAPAKIASALNPTQFDAYLRDHLLLDKSVDET